MPGTVAFAWSGSYRLAVFSPKGVGVTLQLIRPGDGFGYTASVLGRDFGEGLRLTADQGGALLCLPAREFMAIVSESQSLMRALLHAMAATLAENGSRIYELSALDVRARLLAELVRLVQHQLETDGVLSLEPAPTHAALAAQIGATRENVTRHLKDLEREGIVRLGRRSLEVLDLERLRALDQDAAGRRVDFATTESLNSLPD
jgi:CRP-like cAMP-binding protein